MPSLHLEIVTPERRVFSEDVDHVVLPTHRLGEIDVLPGHLPLLTMLEPGAIRFFKGGKEDTLAVDKGFIEVFSDHVRVLTEAAIEVQKIDPTALEEARRRAEASLAEAKARGDDPEVIEQLETKARFAVIQKIVADSRRS